MEQRLYKAALEGSVTSLHELLREDPVVLDRVTLNCFNETPLHVAAMRGHFDFVKEIVARNPELAGELDSQGLSPLHWASAKGHLEIVKTLLSVKPGMCFARDQDGRNPLHLAAIKGQVSVLKELLQAGPDAARAIVSDKGATILHLCVQHNQLEVLKLLLETMNDHEFANSKDEHGNTILDLAVVDKKIETTKYLLSRSVRIDVNASNADGLKALDSLAQSEREIDIVQDLDSGNENGTTCIRRNCKMFLTHLLQFLDILEHSFDSVMEIRNGLMTVASLMLTLTFQIGVSPPGGLWQDDLLAVDSEGKAVQNPHKAGEAIMAYKSPNLYTWVYYANLLSFTTSLAAMIFLIIPFPLKKKVFSMPLIGLMASTLVLVATTYYVSISAMTPDKLEKQLLARPSPSAARIWRVLYVTTTLPFLILVFMLVPLWLKSRKESKRTAPTSKTSVDINHAPNRDRPQIDHFP